MGKLEVTKFLGELFVLLVGVGELVAEGLQGKVEFGELEVFGVEELLGLLVFYL